MNTDTDTDNQHCYFLDAEQAYIQASKTLTISNGNEQSLQYCYYDGPLTDITLPNFIQVPQNEFVDFFSNNQLAVPTLIIYPDGKKLNLETNSPDILEDIARYRKQLKIELYPHKDSYFVDPLMALNTAKQNNRVYCNHPTIDGRQVCFYNGKTFENGPENLVSVPFNELIHFFTETRYRKPQKLIVPDELEEPIKKEVIDTYNNAMTAVENQKNELASKLVEQVKSLKPDFSDEQLRIFLPANRLTQVMQYSSRNIAKEITKAGHEAYLHIEDNDMEELNSIHFFQAILSFKPDVFFQINHLNNHFLHDEMINFVWYQDPMPAIQKKKPLPWRDNDIVMVYGKLQEDLVKACGQHSIIQQSMCIDEEVFYCTPDTPRKNKIVFVGSSYHQHISNYNDAQIMALQHFKTLFEQGITPDKKLISNIAEEHHISVADITYGINYIVRDTSVEWLCSQNILPFELYGRGWNDSELTKSHNHGEVEHGKAVADIYRQAKFALVNLPWEVESQRLAEIIACGCIPIVYDARKYSDYIDYLGLLYYKTQDELLDILNRHEQINHLPDLPEKFTYSYLAKNIINLTTDKISLKTVELSE